MGRSSSLRLADVRGVFRLLNEIQLQRDDPDASQRHMVFGLCDLLGARQGAALQWSGFSPTGNLELLGFAHGGWPCSRAAELWEAALKIGSWRGDPILNRAIQIPGMVRTRLREQLVDDREWYASVMVTEIARLNEHDHPLVAWQRREEGKKADRVDGLAFHRSWGERSFSSRERNILHLFNVELYRMRREGKFDPPPLPLTPRQHQVLKLLLAGEGEKQVAHRLRISRHTVNDHVRAIYRRLGINSRGELMARFIRHQP